MGNLWIKTRVPPGSRLELGVPPVDQPFAASARLVDSGSNEKQWTDEELRPGPAVEPLAGADSFVVRIRVGFADDGVAKVRALIRKPNGFVYGGRYQYVINGKAGDVVRATLVITML